MEKAYKFRIYPNKQQEELINNKKSNNNTVLGKIYGYFFNN